MVKRCCFCFHEIKNQNFSVHYPCKSYFHTRCFNHVENDPKSCQGCYPRLQNRTDLTFRHASYSTDIRHMKAEIANLKKEIKVQNPKKARPNVAARGNVHDAHGNQLHRAAGGQHHRHANNGKRALNPAGGGHLLGVFGNQLPKVIGGQKNHAKQVPKVAPGHHRQVNNGHQQHRAAGGQLHHGNNGKQALNPAGGGRLNDNFGNLLNKDVGRQHHHAQQVPNFAVVQHRHDNGKHLLQLAGGNHLDDNSALFNRTMNCVLFPTTEETWHPRVLKVKLLRTFADWNNPNVNHKGRQDLFERMW